MKENVIRALRWLLETKVKDFYNLDNNYNFRLCRFMIAKGAFGDVLKVMRRKDRSIIYAMNGIFLFVWH